MTTRGLLLLLVAAGLGVGCGLDDRDQRYESEDRTNTALNERDRTEAYPLPSDQSANEQDMLLTQSIRKMIMDDASLSIMAKNVKIVTTDGKVTLRGPVRSEAEKATIAAHAEHVVGAGKVDNMLEIATGE